MSNRGAAVVIVTVTFMISLHCADVAIILKGNHSRGHRHNGIRDSFTSRR